MGFVGFFCQDCFLESHDFYTMPKALLLRKCAKCKKARFNKDFETYSDELFLAWLVSKIKPKFTLESFSGKIHPAKNAIIADLKLNFMAQAIPITKELSFKVDIDSNACTQCSRQSGGYHEALIQIRSKYKEKLARLAEKVAKEVEKNSYVGAYEWLPEGVDIQVGDKKTAMQAAQKLEKPYSVSHTLVGQKKGKRLFRDTILVRV